MSITKELSFLLDLLSFEQEVFNKIFRTCILLAIHWKTKLAILV